ncbi:MAG: AMP-binding protein, partial [bacterium]|nr:AMP-binding protein [bacterium]
LSLYFTDDHTLLDANKLARFLKSHQITILWLTSALFNSLSHQDPAMFSPLRVLLVGGDVLNPAQINRVGQACKNLQIINGYGPTENTTFSTTYLIDRDFRENIPIGKPIANTTAYILDRVGRLQPVGAVGELCFSGDGLARGYLNQPELTAEKFYRSYKTDRSYILYKTGDLARWLQDGNIEFLGRMDDQVKIRGFRIEPGEIQNKLLQYQGIKEALVTVHTGETGEKSLCAYAVGDFDTKPLKDFLAQSLPDY